MTEDAASSYSEDSDYYEDAFSNPLRLAYYVLHPIGFTAEWLIMRPFHSSSHAHTCKFFATNPSAKNRSTAAWASTCEKRGRV